MSESSTIRWERDDDGVVILTLDDPNQSANTMNAAYAASMQATVDRLEARARRDHGRDHHLGQEDVLRRRRPQRSAGRRPRSTPSEIASFIREAKAVLRRLETLGRPVVAAVNGAALGGGLEIMLACHHRIVVDDPKIQLGFPEVQLGLLPGAGGVTRTVRMLGIVNALLQLLLQGQRVRPDKGKEIGIVDELVASPEELIPAAKRWIEANPEAVQPWDVKGYKIPGGTPSTPALAQNLPAFPANLRKQLKGANYPAPREHHGRRGRGRAGRLRQRARDRGPLLRRPGHEPGGQEHDPGVLLRHAARNRRPRPSRGDRDVQAEQDGRPGRRDDGRRDRLRVRQGRDRGGAQGRVARGRAARQGLLREARRQGGRARPLDPGAGRRAAGADHADQPTRPPPTVPSW